MGWIIGSIVSRRNGKVSGFRAINAIFSDSYAVVVLGNEYREATQTVFGSPQPARYASILNAYYRSASKR
jgi:hypothetical protein